MQITKNISFDVKDIMNILYDDKEKDKHVFVSAEETKYADEEEIVKPPEGKRGYTTFYN